MVIGLPLENFALKGFPFQKGIDQLYVYNYKRVYCLYMLYNKVYKVSQG